MSPQTKYIHSRRITEIMFKVSSRNIYAKQNLVMRIEFVMSCDLVMRFYLEIRYGLGKRDVLVIITKSIFCYRKESRHSNV